MQFVSKLSPGQWVEVRRLRAGGTGDAELAQRYGISTSSIRKRACKEGWGSPARPAAAVPSRAALGRASPATASIRSRLALRLYSVIECKIRMMELRMIKELQAHERARADADAPPPPINDERESFAALIDSINQVTEMAAEPAPATDGRRSAARGGAINPELTALSADIDPDGLAIASEKDNYRREIAERLGRMFPKP
jgi:hypothetical protein